MKNPFLDRSSLSRVATSELKLGMFVAELDRPWLETPFLIQGFSIKSRAEIRTLAEYCRFVYVDMGGRAWSGKENPFKDPFKTAKPGSGQEEGAYHQKRKRQLSEEFNLLETRNKREAHIATATVYEEHSAARDTYVKAKVALQSLQKQVLSAGLVDVNTAKAIASHCVESLLRNPDALMWMTRIKPGGDYIVEHALNASILAIAFGRHLSLAKTELIKLGVCGLLYDIGKLKMDEALLNKSEVLGDEELEQLKEHTTIGRDLLKNASGSFQYVIEAAYNHHEQIDGKGYPRQLPAGELTDYTKIISIVDAYDAMTSDRSYASAKSNLDALKEIYKGRGKQFDDALALEFVSVIGPYPPGTIVELQNGSVGIVLHSKIKKRHLPAVEIVRDSNGKEIEPKVIDLLETEHGVLPKDYLIKKVLKNGERGIRIQNFPVKLLMDPEASQE